MGLPRWGPAGAPVRSAAGDELYLAVTFYDDCRVATRSVEGEWTVSDMVDGVFASDSVARAVASPGGAVVSTRTSIDQRAGENDFVPVVDIVTPLNLDVDRAGFIGKLSAMVERSGWRQSRSDQRLHSVEVFERSGVALDGDKLVEGGAARGGIPLRERTLLGRGAVPPADQRR